MQLKIFKEMVGGNLSIADLFWAVKTKSLISNLLGLHDALNAALGVMVRTSFPPLHALNFGSGEIQQDIFCGK